MLKFYYGPSGSGKSSRIQEDLIRRSGKEPDRLFFVITPDQYTLALQKDIVLRSPNKGIMNIEILSFSRLAYKVFEEVGVKDRLPLDDTGKNLIVRKVSLDIKEDLKSLGTNLTKPGYIHEVKSIISEFMQYGIGEKEIETLLCATKDRPSLNDKLADIALIYKGYNKYIADKYITTEERLEILSSVIDKSAMLKNSIVILDGFTGFTPLQNHVIQSLMQVCAEIWMSVTIDREGLLNDNCTDQLFALSKRTINSMKNLAKDVMPLGEPMVLEESYRCKEAPALKHLERNLFRYPYSKYANKTENLAIKVFDNPKEELRQACIGIRKLIQENEYEYREIAIVTGDVERYAPYAQEMFSTYNIPGFVDVTHKLSINPFTEFIKSGLGIISNDYSYDSVMHFLRSGFTGIDKDEIDIFDNYITALGIRGFRKYSEDFVRYPKYMRRMVDNKLSITEESVSELSQVNVIRNKIMTVVSEIATLSKKKTYKAIELAKKVYSFITSNDMYDKLDTYEKKFAKAGDYVREAEYRQVYEKFMELLDTMANLLGEDEVTVEEFIKILEAGLTEIKIGVLPQGVDYVVLGDIERTRLNNIKVLFFIGVNDGVVPVSSSGGGMISDIDREFIASQDIELAPTPRQKINIQRLYLYLNMTKPSDKLILSYSRMDKDGNSIRPSYLIKTITGMYPALEIEGDGSNLVEDVVGIKDAGIVLARLLREYAAGENNKEQLATLYMRCKNDNYELTQRLTAAAFYAHKEERLRREIVNALYGLTIQNSISRLEKYAACAYSHFLQYGLKLNEREEYSFDSLDMGNVFHEVLDAFGKKLSDIGKAWTELTKEEADAILDPIMVSVTSSYGESVLFRDNRSGYLATKMKRILLRTVMTIAYQLRKGLYTPKKYEFIFRSEIDPKNIVTKLNANEKMVINGKVDRIDTYETGDKVYVKIVDYKSGDKELDLVELYYGTQLQLVVYLNQSIKALEKGNEDKQVIPAALMYYHIDDPIIDEKTKILTEDEIDAEIIKELRPRGYINADNEIIRSLDANIESKSDVIRVTYKKDGGFDSNTKVLDASELSTVMRYADKKIGELGSDILEGKIDVAPCKEETCRLCSFREVCEFDKAIKGFEFQKQEITKDEVLPKMKEDVGDE